MVDFCLPLIQLIYDFLWLVSLILGLSWKFTVYAEFSWAESITNSLPSRSSNNFNPQHAW